MKVLIAGSHGMVGSAVTRYLTECGYEVARLVRHTPGAGEVVWNPDVGEIDQAGLDGFDGVVQVASMPWPMRWTPSVKKKLLANRVGTNQLIAEALAKCVHKPQVLVCAAGQGYYPPSGDEILTENCPRGSSFLALLDEQGEEATAPASQAGIRVVHLRIPTVLGGERLKQLGFQAGNGRQWMSWIGLDELASIIEFALRTDLLSGPVNASSPNPMRLADVARVACEALGQKLRGAMPAFMVRLIMGEMGKEFILASRRVQPAKLLAAGYCFRFADLADALRHEIDNLHGTGTAARVGNAAAI